MENKDNNGSKIEIKCHTCQNRAPMLFSNYDWKKKKINIANLAFLSGRGRILRINRHLFNLRLTIAFNHFRGNNFLKNVPFPVVNLNNLVVWPRSRRNGKLNLDEWKIHVGEEGDGLLSEVLKALPVLRPQQVKEWLQVLILLDSISLCLVNGFTKRGHFCR